MKVWQVTCIDKNETFWTGLYTTKEVAEEVVRLEREEDGDFYDYEIDEKTVYTSALEEEV